MLQNEKLDGMYWVRVEKDIEDKYRKLSREHRRQISEKTRKLLRKLILGK